MGKGRIEERISTNEAATPSRPDEAEPCVPSQEIQVQLVIGETIRDLMPRRGNNGDIRYKVRSYCRSNVCEQRGGLQQDLKYKHENQQDLIVRWTRC